MYSVFFLTGSALKVLSVVDGKIPYQKSESKGISQRKCDVLTRTVIFLGAKGGTKNAKNVIQ